MTWSMLRDGLAVTGVILLILAGLGARAAKRLVDDAFS